MRNSAEREMFIRRRERARPGQRCRCGTEEDLVARQTGTSALDLAGREPSPSGDGWCERRTERESGDRMAKRENITRGSNKFPSERLLCLGSREELRDGLANFELFAFRLVFGLGPDQNFNVFVEGGSPWRFSPWPAQTLNIPLLTLDTSHFKPCRKSIQASHAADNRLWRHGWRQYNVNTAALVHDVTAQAVPCRPHSENITIECVSKFNRTPLWCVLIDITITDEWLALLRRKLQLGEQWGKEGSLRPAVGSLAGYRCNWRSVTSRSLFMVFTNTRTCSHLYRHGELLWLLAR